jgi:hypothetical protein
VVGGIGKYGFENARFGAGNLVGEGVHKTSKTALTRKITA